MRSGRLRIRCTGESISPGSFACPPARMPSPCICRPGCVPHNALLTATHRVWALICLSFGVPLASVNNFLPQIVASLGYSPVKTNLYTVAPNIVGTVALIILTQSSDYFRERSIHM